jgi:hypothetical protein
VPTNAPQRTTRREHSEQFSRRLEVQTCALLPTDAQDTRRYVTLGPSSKAAMNDCVSLDDALVGANGFSRGRMVLRGKSNEGAFGCITGQA